MRPSRSGKTSLAFVFAMGEKLPMTCTVKIANGTISLPPGVKLSDGTEVQLTLPDAATSPTFADRYSAYIGAADDLPTDLAANLDHYIHSQPRK
jgi:hypothetical protein